MKFNIMLEPFMCAPITIIISNELGRTREVLRTRIWRDTTRVDRMESIASGWKEERI